MKWCRALSVLAIAAVGGCAADPAPAKAPVGRSKAGQPANVTLPGPPALPAALLTSGEGDSPVAFAQASDGGLVAYVQGGKLVARTTKRGPALGPPVDLGPIGGVGAFSLKAHADGYVIFWSERVDQNHLFKLLRLDAKGAAKGPVVELPPVPAAAVPYADFAPVGDRGLIIHEVEAADQSTVYVTAVPAAGEKSSPRAVAQGALGWTATQTPTGVAFGIVRPPDKLPKDTPRVLGNIDVVFVGPDATVGAPVRVLEAPTAEIDLEMASVGGNVLVGWTDSTDDAGAVRIAVVDGAGKLASPPALLAPPIGDQALVGLVAEPTGKGKHALVAWENIGQRVSGTRVLQLAALGADGKPGKERTRLLLDADERPDLVADESGFAALTLAPARTRQAGEAVAAPSWPTLVTFGEDLTPRGAEPVRFVGPRSRDGVPGATFGLSCRKGSCFALAADVGPERRFLVELPERSSAWQAPAWRADDERPPKITSLFTVADGPRLSQTRALRLPGEGAGTITSWVTYHLDGTTAAEPAPKGESPFAATLGVRPIDPNGTLGAPVILSKRALSSGGVALAAISGKRPEVVVAWVASDKGTPQVFVTKVDGKGQKIAQKKVTVIERSKKKGAEGTSFAFDVAVADSPAVKSRDGSSGTDGLVLAWVDTRDGDAEVYAARINRDLEKTVVDKRITSAKGDAAEVSLLVRGADAFVAFAEARDGKPADIYLSHLDALTLKEIDEDARVYASAGRSRSPRLFSVGDRVALAWIEDPAPGDKQSATLRIGEIDSTGRLVGAPRVVAAPEGASITAYALECSGPKWSQCRGVIAWAREGGHPEIAGLSFADDAAATPSLTTLGSLTSGTFADPSLTLADPSAHELYYIEDTGERGRVRRVSLAW
ncbi:MAG: hypothetical protein JNL21_14815 [Myxococcales bacterium]|nr:hypothetical protein [Myxococcales bacterium]